MVNDDRWTKEWERTRFRDDERRSREEGPRRGGGARVYRGREIDRGGRDHGGGYGAERYGRAYPDYDQRDDERRYGGNDYNRGFYGADQGYRSRRGPHQETREDQGERGGWERFSDEISSWFGDDEASRRRDHDVNQGDRGAQHHRGRGPKGYARSDHRIQEDVNDRLTDDPHVDASEIEVSVSNREVTLSGMVNSRFEKRHAEDLAESVSGVTHVQNNLRVQQQNALAGMGGSASTTTSGMGAGESGASGGTGMGSSGSTGSAGASVGANRTGAAGRRRSSTTET